MSNLPPIPTLEEIIRQAAQMGILACSNQWGLLSLAKLWHYCEANPDATVKQAMEATVKAAGTDGAEGASKLADYWEGN